MRTPILMLLLLLMMGVNFSEAAKTDFFICTSANNKKGASYIPWFELKVFKALKKEFPCVEISSQSTIASILELERMKQLLGGEERDLASIGGAMGSDYLVGLQVTYAPGSIMVNAFCAYTRTSEVIARAMEIATNADDAIDAIERVSKQLVEGLKKYEICPFKGPINVIVKTELTDKKTESYTVYCNSLDGLYKRDITTNNSSDANWKLSKTSKNRVIGSVTYILQEETEKEEHNDCYICPSGRQGSRLYKETVLKTAKVEGLSNESIADNQQIEDARAIITFIDNGTYTLRVKAASRKGDLKLRTEKKAEGTCDNQNPPPESIDKKADVSLKETTFGPFPGTSLDKVLSHKDTFTTIDPVTKEKTTITYDFDLKRD